jgi:BlaI family transcriptional regulator, penicillinase repressor
MTILMSDIRGLRLGELQLEILRALWLIGSGTVAEIHQRLDRSDALAVNTIATLLRRMEGRGLVRHKQDGRKFVYEALVTEQDVTASAADDMLDRFFEGRLADMFHHLLQSREVSRAELAKLEKLIAARKKKR